MVSQTFEPRTWEHIWQHLHNDLTVLANIHFIVKWKFQYSKNENFKVLFEQIVQDPFLHVL